MNYYKPTRSELSILILLVVAIAGVGYLLYQNLSESTRADVEASLRLGQIQYTKGEVKIRPSDSFMWDDAQGGYYVVDKDKVFNGKQSSSKIKLTNNTLIDLGPNTLVQFFRDKEGAVGIDVSSGTLNIDSSASSKDLLLKLSGLTQSYKLDKGKMAINLSKSDGRKIQCPSYDITYLDGAKDVGTVQKGVQKRVDCQGRTLQSEILDFRAVAPTGDAKIYEGQPLTFTWRALTDESPSDVILNISKIEANKETQMHTQVVSDRLDQSHSGMPAGTYRWSLDAKDGKQLSSSSTFNVSALPFPDIISPKQEAFIYSQQQSLTFMWQKKMGVDQHRLQIAADPQFKDIIVNRLTTQSEYVTTPAEFADLKTKGTFYWRLIPLLQDTSVVKSALVTLPSQQTTLADAASRIFPPNRHVFEETEDLSKSITFLWPDTLVGTYQFELTSENKIISSSAPSSGKTLVERIPPGTYRWTVNEVVDGRPARLFTQEFDVVSRISPEKLMELSSADISHSATQNKFSPLSWDVEFAFRNPAFIMENFDITFKEIEGEQKPQEADRRIASLDKKVYRELTPQKYTLILTQKGTENVMLSYPVDLNVSPIGPPKDLHFLVSTEDNQRVLHMNWDRVDLAQSYEIQIYQEVGNQYAFYASEKVLTTEGSGLSLVDQALYGKKLMIITQAVDPTGRPSASLQKEYFMRH